MARSRSPSVEQQKLKTARATLGFGSSLISEQAIHAAYHQLALKYHPDRPTADSDKFQEAKYARDLLLKHFRRNLRRTSEGQGRFSFLMEMTLSKNASHVNSSRRQSTNFSHNMTDPGNPLPTLKDKAILRKNCLKHPSFRKRAPPTASVGPATRSEPISAKSISRGRVLAEFNTNTSFSGSEPGPRMVINRKPKSSYPQSTDDGCGVGAIPFEQIDLDTSSQLDHELLKLSPIWTLILPVSQEDIVRRKRFIYHFTKHYLSGETTHAEIDFQIPQGCRNNSLLSFPSQGHQLPNGRFQDVDFIIQYQPPRFVYERDGDDVWMRVTLPWDDVLEEKEKSFSVVGPGGEVHRITVDFKKERMIQGVVTFREAGMPRAGGMRRGDLIIEWEIGEVNN